MLKKLAPLFLALSATLFAARFGIDHIGRIVRLADPQIAPDGKSIALVVSRTNYEKTATTRNWCSSTPDPRPESPDPRSAWREPTTVVARRIAAGIPGTVDTRPQIFILPMTNGDAWQVTKSPTGAQQFA